MLKVQSAFRAYGRAVVLPPGSQPAILVSSAPDSQKLAGQITQWAVAESGHGNGNLQNIGVAPEEQERAEQVGIAANLLLIHAVKETPAVLTLSETLSEVMSTKLVYTMPSTPQPVPQHVIWLQFGPGLRWRNDVRETR